MRFIGSFRILSVAAPLAAVVTFGANPGATTAAPVAAEAVVVMTDNMVFEPATITIPAGTTVTWVNQGISPHAVRAVGDAFNSGSDPSQWILADGTFSFTFDSPGTYAYICEPHVPVGMAGTVIVQ
jgi:plastocyanin